MRARDQSGLDHSAPHLDSVIAAYAPGQLRSSVADLRVVECLVQRDDQSLGVQSAVHRRESLSVLFRD